ncbi:DUF3800 domain-containing protein [Corynebacterium sp.]|uniref:DUF3800 domain-containing protein n=1 Tax=Corynebacterium sp. TaxID=1720 RepID=UPI0028AE12A5|nr:DUF3800 domain-containing protein [Corynebacterium sp.]
MYVAYLDETFHKDREHSVLGLVAPMNTVATVEANLDRVVAKACRQHGNIPEDAELHGYELSAGEGAWAALTTPRARVRIYNDAIRAITAVEGLTVCRGTLDLSSRSPNDAHSWSLTFVLECINSTVSRRSDRVLGICDDVQNKSVYQDMYAHARRHGTRGNFPNKLAAFTDGLHFTPSHHSRMVQAIDLISYVYRRNHIVKYNDSRASKAFERLWNQVEPLFEPGGCRTW